MAVAESLGELTRHAVDVLPDRGLERRLELGRPLRVKLGVDPTGPDIHLGFAVVLRRLRAFQDAGHTAVLIVGDYTARIGDPSGRSKERLVLADEVLDRNAKLFAEQAYRILDPERTEIRFNGEWLGKLDYAELVRLTRIGTVARLLERNDFAERFAKGDPITVSELLYPFAQGYDSVAVQADVEVGGSDQLYELLVGTDGVDKMSKSQGNYVAIDEPPEEQFGKVMSIPDEALAQWWPLILEQEPPRDDPMAAKLALARRIVERYHGPDAAGRAEQHFTRVVRERETPEQVPEAPLPPGDPLHVPAVLVEALGLPSTSEARRLLEQGAIRVDGEVVRDLELPRERLADAVVQAGRR